MTILKVSERDLLFALASRLPGTSHFLDLKSGEVIPVFSYNRETILAQVKQAPDRFLRLAPLSGRQGYEIMERFTATVSRPELRQRLTAALKDEHAFRQFQAVLKEFPAEYQRWRQFRTFLMVQGVRDRLEPLGIELELVPEPGKPKGDHDSGPI